MKRLLSFNSIGCFTASDQASQNVRSRAVFHSTLVVLKVSLSTGSANLETSRAAWEILSLLGTCVDSEDKHSCCAECVLLVAVERSQHWKSNSNNKSISGIASHSTVPLSLSHSGAILPTQEPTLPFASIIQDKKNTKVMYLPNFFEERLPRKIIGIGFVLCGMLDIARSMTDNQVQCILLSSRTDVEQSPSLTNITRNCSGSKSSLLAHSSQPLPPVFAAGTTTQKNPGQILSAEAFT